jgi:3-isopropylmalate/(R)-2-methylmalate dehydratase large subunit
VLGNDVTSPVAIMEFEKTGYETVFAQYKNRARDGSLHPEQNIKAAEQCKFIRDFARKHKIVNYYDVGDMGVEHALLPEKGLVVREISSSERIPTPARTERSARFSTGVGSTDMAGGMARGNIVVQSAFGDQVCPDGKITEMGYPAKT